MHRRCPAWGPKRRSRVPCCEGLRTEQAPPHVALQELQQFVVATAQLSTAEAKVVLAHKAAELRQELRVLESKPVKMLEVGGASLDLLIFRFIIIDLLIS